MNMQTMSALDVFQMLVIIGGFSGLVWLLFLLLVRVLQIIVAWTNDEQVSKYNSLVALLMNWAGYDKYQYGGYIHRITKTTQYDGCNVVGLNGFLVFMFVPAISYSIIYLTIEHIPIVIGFVLLPFILFLIRMIKRQNKLLQLHINNTHEKR